MTVKSDSVFDEGDTILDINAKCRPIFEKPGEYWIKGKNRCQYK